MSETQAQRVFRLLRASFASGELAPGSQVSEAALIERFKVSRTPIREATLRLEQEGVLGRSSGRLIVAKLSYGAAADLYTARAALEGMCTFLATQVVSGVQIDGLEQILKQSSQALEEKDFEKVALCNAEFHTKIEKLADNRFLSESIDKIDLWTERYRRAAVVSFGRAEDALADHRLIVEVMRQGDPNEAQRAMKIHILNAGRSFLEALRLFQGEDSTNPASMALEAFEGNLAVSSRAITAKQANG